MESEFNSYSFEEDFQENEVVLGTSGRFVFSKKRIYGRMHFLKRPSDKYKNDLITIESLRKEFAIGYSLDHPYIAKYFRFENDTLFEEYIDGKSLRALIEDDDPRLNDKQFLQNLCLQFLDVLGYLKEMGIVHNDIKPENVIITRIGNTVKLVDFNCAQTSDRDILGGYTTSYKAPEQGVGEIDSSSDLYQVGKVMEELSSRVGFKNNWKRFVEGTTANHPENRVSLELAKKLVPGKYQFKTLSLIISSLIILSVFTIILFPREETETNLPQTETPHRDTVIIEKIKEPGIEKINEKPQRPTVDIRKVVEQKILDYSDNYFKQNVYPICKEAMENGRRLNYEEESEFNQAINKAYEAAMEYVSELSTEYPAEKNYIEQECLKTFEMKYSALALKLYSD